MRMIEGLLQELEQEAQTTKRVLARVPTDRLAWKPHEKSMTLGELALHVAELPSGIAQLAMTIPFTPPDFSQRPSADATTDLPATLERSVAAARSTLGHLSDAEMAATWRMVAGDREILALPRAAVLRALMLNHWYHHRGQLTVYLRELQVPVPSIYGPSADENPFALTTPEAASAASVAAGL